MTKTLKGLLTAAVVGLLFYFSFGFFAIQPVGAVPDRATFLHFRRGLNVTFISSADGILLDNDQDASLPGRMVILGKFGEILKERKIASLPYSRTMYLISTGGKEFEK